MHISGIHHVTAITGHAAHNVAFYTEVLGMRLVKKTVNQDDLSAYHLFYGDEVGHPGTELTFFDWPESVQNQPGAGMVSSISLRVGHGSLAWWMQRLATIGVDHESIAERAGHRTVAFADPEGQRLILVEDAATAAGTPWTGGPVPATMGIRGLGPVTLAVARAEPTVAMLTAALSFQPAGEYASPEDGLPISVYATGEGGPGAEVHLAVRPQLRRGIAGIGGVHHVAFRTPNAEEHIAWQQRIAAAGLRPTQVIDRFYFRSVYFREPGGVLCEIATDGPGFTADEDAAHLGEHLSLPPFLEPQRAAIEAGLKPLIRDPTSPGINVLTHDQVREERGS